MHTCAQLIGHLQALYTIFLQDHRAPAPMGVDQSGTQSNYDHVYFSTSGFMSDRLPRTRFSFRFHPRLIRYTTGISDESWRAICLDRVRYAKMLPFFWLALHSIGVFFVTFRYRNPKNEAGNILIGPAILESRCKIP